MTISARGRPRGPCHHRELRGACPGATALLSSGFLGNRGIFGGRHCCSRRRSPRRFTYAGAKGPVLPAHPAGAGTTRGPFLPRELLYTQPPLSAGFTVGPADLRLPKEPVVHCAQSEVRSAFPGGPVSTGACPPHPGSRRPWRVPCPRGLSTWCPASKASSTGGDGGDGSWGECPRASRPAGPGPPEPGGVECLSAAVMGVKGLDVGGVGSGPVRCVAFHQGTVTFLPRPPLTAGAEPHKVAEAAPSPTKPAQEDEH